MRARIIDAAITSLSEHGYGATATLMVQRIGALSRGAMLHQFPTKADVMLATLERVLDLNHLFFGARLGALPDPVERFLGLVDTRWELANQPHGIAQLEILVGARSDELVKRRYPEFLQRMRARQSRRFAEWAEAAGLSLTAQDHQPSRLIVFALRGMAVEKQGAPALNAEPIMRMLRALRRGAVAERLGIDPHPPG